MTTWKTASPADRKLAAALHKIDLPGLLFDANAARGALEWVRRLDAAKPTTGRESAAALVNNDSMREYAEQRYDAEPKYCERHNRLFAAWHASRFPVAAVAA